MRRLLLIGLIAGATAPPPPTPLEATPFHVAMFAQIRNRHGTPPPGGQLALSTPLENCAAYLAIKHIKERNGAVAPALALLSGPMNITLHTFDTGGTVHDAVHAFNYAWNTLKPQQGLHAFLGPPSDEEITVVGQTATVRQVPMMGHRAMSHDFQSRDVHDGYPYFSRVDTDRTHVAQGIRKALRELGISS